MVLLKRLMAKLTDKAPGLILLMVSLKKLMAELTDKLPGLSF
jgi:hypothetical protein